MKRQHTPVIKNQMSALLQLFEADGGAKSFMKS